MGVVVCLFGGNTFGLWGWRYGHWVTIRLPCRVIVVLSFGGNTCNLYERSLGCAKARGFFLKISLNFKAIMIGLLTFPFFRCSKYGT